MERILEEYDEVESNPSDDFMVRMLDWNEWLGALRGPSGTEFAGGIYHMLLRFPNEYPWKEPSFIFWTENGSFSIETKTNARLKWDPRRTTVRQAFLQLIELMPECPDFESESKSEEHREKRRHLAGKSFEAAREYGSSEQQNLIRRIHQYMRNQRREEKVVVDPVPSTQMVNREHSLKERILKEYNEIQSNPSYDFTCLKKSWDDYEWQFAIRGPRGTEFEDGIYHGKVQFSVGFPTKPPSIVFLTENGCVKTQTSASLKVLQDWQPRSVRHLLLSVVDEMLSYSNGDLVPVENIWEARRRLAINSRAESPKYGRAYCRELMAEIHEHMLIKPYVPEPSHVTSQASNGTGSGPVVNININFWNTWNIDFWNTWKSISGNIFVFSHANNSGISNAMNDRMITTCFWVMFLVLLFAVWSY